MSDFNGDAIQFDEAFYLKSYPYTRHIDLPPQVYYQKYGRRLGHLPNANAGPQNLLAASSLEAEQGELLSQNNPPYAQMIPQRDFDAVVEDMDLTWYASLFPKGSEPADPVMHYLCEGSKSGYEPAPWFSTPHYIASYPDVLTSGMNPFVHYVLVGKKENRKLPLKENGRKAHAVDAYRAHATASAAGPLFEDFDPHLGKNKSVKAKVMAYYLPQYHAFAENDAFWGKGFTEWRNVVRGMPRFEGHRQPRIPRDLGFYSLNEVDTLRRQFDMARSAGIHGFCFYHYWFDGRRVMESPMEKLLADPSLDIPFSIMWANENWSRTWDGNEAELLLKQTYQFEDEIAFVDDLARHFKDKRYIQIDGRPIFFIYRASSIPDTAGTISRWRDLLEKRHDLRPLFFMAQSFDDENPRKYGFDGAIEFPPHKILDTGSEITKDVRLLDPDFSGMIFDYEKIVAEAIVPRRVRYPLIRTILPSWDNDARRPGRSTIIANSTPKAFGLWARHALEQAQAQRVFGEAIICVNAWNEWAEGAYLEPDTHFGGAYLNELSRAIWAD